MKRGSGQRDRRENIGTKPQAHTKREKKRSLAHTKRGKYLRSNLEVGIRQLIIGVVGLRDDDLVLDNHLHRHKDVVLGLGAAVANQLLHPGTHAPHHAVDRPHDAVQPRRQNSV